MQTAPAGTYKGMLDCAGGILKNEGPLAFYKVWCAPRFPDTSCGLTTAPAHFFPVRRAPSHHCSASGSACRSSSARSSIQNATLRPKMFSMAGEVRTARRWGAASSSSRGCSLDSPTAWSRGPSSTSLSVSALSYPCISAPPHNHRYCFNLGSRRCLASIFPFRRLEATLSTATAPR